MTDLKLSIAIPVFNESSVIDELLRRIRQVLESVPGGPHEVIFVDDGSTDETLGLLTAAAMSDDRLVVVELSRNFGHQAALSAALQHATGDCVVVLDADLQDPPEAITEMLRLYHQGFDVVYAVRKDRKEPFWLRACYAGFYKVIARVSDITLPENSGDFSLMSRRVVQWINQSPERHRYLRGLRTWYGFKQTGITIERSPRHSGKSKYSLKRLFGLAFDGIFAFSIVPIRLATLAGTMVVFLSMLFAAYSLFAKLFYAETDARSPTGFTAIIFAVVFLGGMQLLFLGIVGEYVGRIYDEVKRRPHYVIKSVTGRAPHVA